MSPCDRCGPAVRALTLVTKGDLEIHLCGHHFRKHEPALLAAGWEVRSDAREKVTA